MAHCRLEFAKVVADHHLVTMLRPAPIFLSSAPKVKCASFRTQETIEARCQSIFVVVPNPMHRSILLCLAGLALVAGLRDFPSDTGSINLDIYGKHKSECEHKTYRKYVLKLVKETPFAGLFRDVKNQVILSKEWQLGALESLYFSYLALIMHQFCIYLSIIHT